MKIQKYKKKAKRPGGSRENDLCTLGIFNITVPKEEGHMAFDIQEELKNCRGNPASI